MPNTAFTQFLAVIISGMMFSGCTGVPVLQKRLTEFEILATHEEPGWGASRRLDFENKYVGWFHPGKGRTASRLSNDDVETLFKAALTVTFYASPKYVDEQRHWLDELERRQLATPQHYRQMYESLVAARHFDEARALSDRRPENDFAPLPVIIDRVTTNTKPTMLAPPLDDNTLVRQPIAKPNPGILIVFSPLCHFSEDAVTTIQSDPDLSRLFEKNTLWLMPPTGQIEFNELRTWLSQHPWKNAGIAWLADEWHDIDLSATPQFYFIRDDRIVDVVAGWPAEGRKTELLQAARKANLSVTRGSAR